MNFSTISRRVAFVVRSFAREFFKGVGVLRAYVPNRSITYFFLSCSGAARNGIVFIGLKTGLTLLGALFQPAATYAQSGEFGPGFGSAYSHRSDNDRAVRAGVVDLMERKKSGLYQAPIYNVTNTTNIAGDQINCDVASTTIGNTGSSVNTGESGAPSVLNSPQIMSGATGNAAGGEAGGPLNAGGSLGTNTIQTTQSVDGSTQTSSVGSSEQGGVNGDVGGSSSNLVQDANNQQSVDSSPLNSSISDSSACAWR